ncbi:MAG: AAA family ATPase, partial [Prevotella nigrescens]
MIILIKIPAPIIQHLYREKQKGPDYFRNQGPHKKGSYVGQTEQQLQSALQTAENVAPCILWIDEIEKGLSGAGSSNDGGVSTRMVGQFL